MSRFLTFEGNLTADPELHVFDDGNASVRFRLVDNPTRTDRRTGEIVKEEPVGMSCVARDPLAREIAASAKKGERLLVWGVLKARAYTDNTGARRTAEYLSVDAAGDSFRFRSRKSAPTAIDASQAPAETPWPEAVQPGSGGHAG